MGSSSIAGVIRGPSPGVSGGLVPANEWDIFWLYVIPFLFLIGLAMVLPSLLLGITMSIRNCFNGNLQAWLNGSMKISGSTKND